MFEVPDLPAENACHAYVKELIELMDGHQVIWKPSCPAPFFLGRCCCCRRALAMMSRRIWLTLQSAKPLDNLQPDAPVLVFEFKISPWYLWRLGEEVVGGKVSVCRPWPVAAAV